MYTWRIIVYVHLAYIINWYKGGVSFFIHGSSCDHYQQTRYKLAALPCSCLLTACFEQTFLSDKEFGYAHSIIDFIFHSSFSWAPGQPPGPGLLILAQAVWQRPDRSFWLMNWPIEGTRYVLELSYSKWHPGSCTRIPKFHCAANKMRVELAICECNYQDAL